MYRIQNFHLALDLAQIPIEIAAHMGEHGSIGLCPAYGFIDYLLVLLRVRCRSSLPIRAFSGLVETHIRSLRRGLHPFPACGGGPQEGSSTWDAQLHRADSRLPVALAIAVALGLLQLASVYSLHGEHQKMQ